MAKYVQSNIIGTVRTCFPEKFGIPRQSLMAKKAWGVVTLNLEFSRPESVRLLETFSHIWILFLFDTEGAWSPTVIPPGDDAPGKVGVFASRSPHRPNPIGMSVVQLEKVLVNPEGYIELHVKGVDLLDGTKVLDIKPYVPYVDSVEGASNGWTKNESTLYEVRYSEEAKTFLQGVNEADKGLLNEILSMDPRPRSQREQYPMRSEGSVGKKFAFRILSYDVHWTIEAGGVVSVVCIKKLTPSTLLRE